MFVHETTIRVRYAETDQMGYVYYGNYAAYYEVARVESLRSLSMTYRELEKTGIIMPVLDLKCKFIRPARYDDLLMIRTTIKDKPGTRMIFHYEVFREDDTLINIGETTLVFVSAETGRPCPMPDNMHQILAPFFDG
jgi:acyl-CoA thioester hydrolase